MSPAKLPSADDHLLPVRHLGSAEIGAMVARTAPAILELLKDGVPRSRNVIITALASRHPKSDVVCSLMRLAVTGEVDKTGATYTTGIAPELEAG